MTRHLIAAVALAVATSNMQPQIKLDETMPPLTGNDLSGRRALLPDAARGRLALLLIGFSYDSRFPVEAWSSSFRQQFDRDPRITFYEIPMIGGVARLGSWFIDAGMRRGTPKSDYAHVITVYGDTKTWKQRVGFSAPDDAYLMLLDRSSKVVWRYNGKFDSGAYQTLASKISALLGPE